MKREGNTANKITPAISPPSHINSNANGTSNRNEYNMKAQTSNRSELQNVNQPPTTSGNARESSNGNLNVNNILAEADNAATAAQIVTLPQGTMTEPPTIIGNVGTSNLQNTIAGPNISATTVALNAVAGNSNNNSNPVSLQTSATASSHGTFSNNMNTNAITPSASIPVDTNNLNGNSTSSINSSQHYQTAMLQNAAIMQQNAATLQHLQHLQQTNKAAATLGMLAPIINNPVQLLAAATPLTFNNTVGTDNVAATTTTLLPTSTVLPATTTNLSETGGVTTIATTPASTHQQLGVPVIAQPAAISISPEIPQTFPIAGITNNSTIPNGASSIVAGSSYNNNDAVQNILRTALMLQNNNFPLLQQGIIPQQQQLVPSSAGTSIMMIPNTSIVPATLTSTNNSNVQSTKDNRGDSSVSNVTKVENNNSDFSNNGSAPTLGAAAAAANAAASVLPPAILNLPLHRQPVNQQPVNAPLAPQMGIDLNSTVNNNNAITLLGNVALRNTDMSNGSNVYNSSLQIAGLATLQQQQQQQQQRIQTIAYPSINLPQSQLSLPLPTHQQQKEQQLPPGNTINPTNSERKKKESEIEKKRPSISRPLYLDHDSNCKLSILICFFTLFSYRSLFG